MMMMTMQQLCSETLAHDIN